MGYQNRYIILIDCLDCLACIYFILLYLPSHITCATKIIYCKLPSNLILCFISLLKHKETKKRKTFITTLNHIFPNHLSIINSIR